MSGGGAATVGSHLDKGARNFDEVEVEQEDETAE